MSSPFCRVQIENGQGNPYMSTSFNISNLNISILLATLIGQIQLRWLVARLDLFGGLTLQQTPNEVLTSTHTILPFGYRLLKLSACTWRVARWHKEVFPTSAFRFPLSALPTFSSTNAAAKSSNWDAPGTGIPWQQPLNPVWNFQWWDPPSLPTSSRR